MNEVCTQKRSCRVGRSCAKYTVAFRREKAPLGPFLIRLPKQFHPFVQRMYAHAQAARNLSSRIASYRNLMNRVPLELLLTFLQLAKLKVLQSEYPGPRKAVIGSSIRQ